MDIGTGIALLGVWLLPVSAMLSRKVTGLGIIIAIAVAFFATYLILGKV